MFLMASDVAQQKVKIYYKHKVDYCEFRQLFMAPAPNITTHFFLIQGFVAMVALKSTH